MMSEQGPPAGWYPDPEGDGQRWWDGQAWTDRTPGSGRSGQAWWKAPAIITAVVLAIVAFGALVNGEGGSDNGGPSAAGARDVCRQFVEDRLRAPSTAEFPPRSGWSVTETGGGWTVRSHVDSQNAFGAQIRSDFTCRVVHRGGGRWSLENLDIAGR